VLLGRSFLYTYALLALALSATSGLASHSERCARLMREQAFRAEQFEELGYHQASHLPLATEFLVRGQPVSFETILRRSARVTLSLGINLQPGDRLLIVGTPSHFFNEFEVSYAGILEQEAYSMGARYVERRPHFDESATHRIRYGIDRKSATDFPDSERRFYEEIASKKKGWTLIHLDPVSNKFANVFIDPDRARVFRDAQHDLQRPFHEAAFHYRMPWTRVMVPTLEYAVHVDPHSELTNLETLYRVWETHIKIMGLDYVDPVAHWRKSNAMLGRVAERLEALKIETLRFRTKDGRTDFEVGIISGCGFIRACDAVDPRGRTFMPNLPSYEIFTWPKMRQVNGRMQTSRPTRLGQRLIEDLWVEFRDGKVVDFGARVGEHYARDMFRRNGALYTGEVALVDTRTPIFKSGLVSGQTIIDENAASHIAVGAPYPLTNSKLDPKQHDKHEVNDSPIHVDLSFGTKDLSVIGIRADGTEVPIMENGKYVSSLTD
jgi:aminopeptidase